MEERNNNVPVNGNKSSMIPGVPAWGSVQYGDGERIEEQFAESEPSKTSSSGFHYNQIIASRLFSPP